MAHTQVQGVKSCHQQTSRMVNRYKNIGSNSRYLLFAGKYKHNMMCDYVIQMPKDSRARIEFKKFALEESAGCKFDKIEVTFVFDLSAQR